MSRKISALVLTTLFVIAPLAGCFGDDEEVKQVVPAESLQIDFLDPEDPSDAELDQDNDGLSNVDEILLGSDPEEQDTDNDEILDGDEVINQTSPILADCLLYTSPSPRDRTRSRMPSSA